MAADPLQNVSKNQPLQLDHRSINAWNDAARAHRATKQNGGAGRLASQRLPPSLHVLIRNDTGADLPIRSVLRITNWLVSPVAYPFEAADHPALTGNTPDDATNRIVITSEPIRNGEIGRAVVMGVAVVDVDINSGQHRYAVPIDGDETKLETAESGPAKILVMESSGSTRRAIVLLGTNKQIVIREYDGSPSSDNIANPPFDALVFPNTSLSESYAGDRTLFVNIASQSATGFVSAISASDIQTWLGIKSISSIGGAFRVPWGVDGYLDLKSIGSTFGTSGSFAGLTATDDGTLDEAAAGWAWDGWHFLISGKDAGGDPINVAYAIRDEADGLIYRGEYGTLGPGAVVRGGIVTDPGSGSFFSGAASDLTGTIDGGTF